MSRELNFLQRIFSIENVEGCYKQICILGIIIKLKKIYRNKHLYKNLPIQNNKIVLESCLGGYNCNPKYIVEEILTRKLPYDIVWAFDNKTTLTGFPEKVRLVKKGSPEYFKECATAKIWISNERMKKCVAKGLYKRDGQFFMDTWHGSIGGKKCTIDRGTLSENEMEPYKIEAEQVDYLISNSAYENEFMKRMFWNNGTVLKYGHPRNDIFFNKEKQQEVREKFFSTYKIPKDYKIALYAPTYRDTLDTSCYSLDTDKLKQALKEKFSGEWLILVRLHPQLFKMQNPPAFPYNVMDVTKYPDMQELLTLTDVLITDYSSSIFDYMITKKPAFIFATDIEEYNNERGLYDSLTSTPFMVASTNEGLYENIINFNQEKYNNDVDKFLEYKGWDEDGHASERVVNLIEKIIEGSNAKV